tara:strand:+ start:272 stop:628 length:357 start_codon:yes stop_codon:yes gene_type:complete
VGRTHYRIDRVLHGNDPKSAAVTDRRKTVRLITVKPVIMTIALCLFGMPSMVQAHFLSHHPENDQCKCAEVNQSWHFHFIQQTSKFKSITRLDQGLDSEESCKILRGERLKWGVFTCP